MIYKTSSLIVAMAFIFFAHSGAAQVISFEKTEINYGTIEQGADGVRLFAFTNTGEAPLVISNAKGSCGCTVPTYPKEPIMPGEAGEIKVRYDTKRLGNFTKYVTLTTNSIEGPSTRLKIFGTVNTPKPAQTESTETE